jgi:ketose-bisphosphate aldolase
MRDGSVKAGHRLRGDVTRNNLPHFARNLNTGGDLAGDARIVQATNTIYHDARHSSAIVVNPVPRGLKAEFGRCEIQCYPQQTIALPLLMSALLGDVMRFLSTSECMQNARREGLVIPAFNIPYLPIMEPVVEALRSTDNFGLIAVARPEWVKFEARSVRAVYEEYQRVKDERFTRLHLDHVPVVDEDNLRVDYEAVIREAIQLGYQSVMVDGSRLSLEENIQATRKVVQIAHAAGVPVEGELGAVFGHEAGPPPPYEELFASGKGFTAPEEAKRFVEETNVDWLSVAIGSVHGAISGVLRHSKKVEARLNLERLDRIYSDVRIPLVLHGGSGIKKDYIREAVRRGIAKINIGTAIRQPYVAALKESPAAARKAAFAATVQVLTEELGLHGTRRVINPEA